MILPRLECRLCGEFPVAVMEGSCVAYPHDVQQIVCAQHYINDGFLEGTREVWVADWFAKYGA